MAKKIRIKSLSKTPEFQNREWAKVISHRQYLLSSTDWTQMDDNDLTMASRVYWNDWRRKVRSIKRNTVSSLEEAESRLKILEENTPERVFIESTTARQKKCHLDIDTIDQAKFDAMNILKQLHGEWCINLMPENLNLIQAKYSELVDYQQTKKFKNYPLLVNTKKTHKFTQKETIEYVMSLKKASDDILLYIDKHFHEYKQAIESSNSIQEVMDVVNRMHGY